MTEVWKEPGSTLKTLIHVLLDRSGSMSGHEADVIGGVNKFIDEQKKVDTPATIAFTRFDSGGVENFRKQQPMNHCHHISNEDFQPRGGTPLLDAVGKTLQQMDNEWREFQADRAIMVIVTDGQENESRKFTKQEIKAMVESRQKSDKWAFIYLGADVNAFAEAGTYGINLSNVAGYTKTSAGIHTAFAAAGETVSMMRATGSTVSMNLGKAALGEDENEARKPAATPPQPQTNSSTPDWTPPA